MKHFAILLLLANILHAQTSYILIVSHGTIQKERAPGKWGSASRLDTIQEAQRLRFVGDGFVSLVGLDGTVAEWEGRDSIYMCKNKVLNKNPRPGVVDLLKILVEQTSDSLRFIPSGRCWFLGGPKQSISAHTALMNTDRDTVHSQNYLLRINRKCLPVNVMITNYFDEEIIKVIVEDTVYNLLLPDVIKVESSIKLKVFSIGKNGCEEERTLFPAIELYTQQLIVEMENRFLYYQDGSVADALLLSSFFEIHSNFNEALKIYESLVKNHDLSEIDKYYGAFIKRVKYH